MILRLGSVGDDVRKLQAKLKDLGLYAGPIDGIFGGATELAVRKFQKKNGLKVDGIVGPKTYSLLLSEEEPSRTEILPLDLRCLTLTGTFETGRPPPECFSAITGNFDGQGISFGALQWNFGQGSLQVLLKDMLSDYRDVMEEIFGEHITVIEEVLKDKESAMEFANSIQHPIRHFIYEPWRGMFKELGRTREFQNIQLRHANKIYNRAQNLSREYGLKTERAIALMFDIIVQCGGIKKVTEAYLRSELKDQEEAIKLELIAKRVSEQVNPRWQTDVYDRKMCIARGRGFVHGVWYDLEEQFMIRLVEV